MADQSQDDLRARVADLEGRVKELEVLQQVVLRVVSATRPLSGVLEQYEATETQEQALYHLLDDVARRSQGPERDRPSFAHFEMKVGEIFPHLRGDRVFIELLLDTLKLERPAYRTLHEYMEAHGWPSWK